MAVSWQMQGCKGFVQRKLPVLVPTKLTCDRAFFPFLLKERGEDIHGYRKAMVAGYHTANGILAVAHT